MASHSGTRYEGGGEKQYGAGAGPPKTREVQAGPKSQRKELEGKAWESGKGTKSAKDRPQTLRASPFKGNGRNHGQGGNKRQVGNGQAFEWQASKLNANRWKA